MGLLSSRSSSSTTQYTQSQQTSASFGDLAQDNLSAGGDLSIYQEGLSHDNLQLVLQSNENATKNAQTLASQAIETTGKAYADAYSGSQNESSKFFDAMRPFAVIAGMIAIFYLWGKK